MIEEWGNFHKITLENESVKVVFTELGADIQAFFVKHPDGSATDIVLGYDSAEEYLADNAFFMGGVPARHAGRIREGHCPIQGQVHQLALRGDHALHTGALNHVAWQFAVEGTGSVKFTNTSLSGTDGLPGNLRVEAVYSLNGGELALRLTAETDEATVVNLTNHSYFNLDGTESVQSVLAQHLEISANQLTALDEGCIPTGEIQSVANTPYDFRVMKPIGQDIEPLPHGYDHNYVFADVPKEIYNIEGTSFEVCQMAKARSAAVELNVSSSQPGLQLYTGKYLSTESGKYGQKYFPFAGFCLEAQHFPDAVHHSHFPSTILMPGQKVDEVILFTVCSLR